MSVEQEIQTLLAQAKALPHNLAQAALIEQAVKLADVHQLSKLQYETRNQLISATIFTGQGHKALATFSWVLNYFDTHEDEMTSTDRWYMMWRYKWVASRLPDFPNISLEVIESTVLDMHRRYKEYGYKEGPIHKKWLWIYMDIGEKDKTIDVYKKWKQAKRSTQSDCPACDQNFEVSYHCFMQDFDKAYDFAKPLLNGEMSCESVPNVTYGKILLTALKKEGRAQADRYHERGYEMISTNIANYYNALRLHLNYLRVTNQHTKMVRILDEHLVGIMNSHSPLVLMFNFRMLHRIFNALDVKTLSLRAPENWPMFKPDGVYNVSELAQWYKNEANDLARRFDERNQNNYYAQWLNEPDMPCAD